MEQPTEQLKPATGRTSIPGQTSRSPSAVQVWGSHTSPLLSSPGQEANPQRSELSSAQTPLSSLNFLPYPLAGDKVARESEAELPPRWMV